MSEDNNYERVKINTINPKSISID